MTRSLLAAGLAFVVGVPSLTAQSLPRYSLPRYSADLSAGRGARTTQSGAVWYAGEREDYLRVGLTVRIGSPGRVRPVLTADYSVGMRGDQVAVCGIAPNGTCFQYFPSTDGLAAGVGVRAMLLSRLTVGGALGMARMEASARYVDADIALRVTRRVHALAHWRRLEWSRAGGGTLWFQPVSVGVRVQ